MCQRFTEGVIFAAEYVSVMDNVCREALSGPYITYCAKRKYDG